MAPHDINRSAGDPPFRSRGWGFLGRRRAAGPDHIGTQLRRIRVSAGYEPAEVPVRAGRPIRLIFHREETAPCSERVIFPDFGMTVMLPAFNDITIDLPACGPGVYPFCCQMKVLHGRLIVEP